MFKICFKFIALIISLSLLLGCAIHPRVDTQTDSWDFDFSVDVDELIKILEDQK